MIHSSPVMPPGNFEDSAPLTPPQTPAKRPFRVPSDYYSAPLSEVRPVFPRWVPYGCGSAAAVFVVLLFVGGAILSGPALGQFLDFIMGVTLGELRPMIAREIPAAQKEAFEAEVNRMREGMRTGKISVQGVQPFLQQMQKAVSDEKVTLQELEALTETARSASSPATTR
jgi:hypothetical protein